MQEIVKQISRKYDFNIINIYPLRDLFIIESSSGKKYLRNIKLSPERIMFIHGAKEHLYANSFIDLDRFICTRDDYPFICIDGIYYTVTEATEGRECDFGKREDVIKASKALANLHIASRGYITPLQSIARDDLGRLPFYFLKRLDEIKRIKKVAQREKGKFDYLILEYIDYFYELGEDAIKRLYNSKYNDLVKKTRREGLFCHHDYTHSNIIFDGNKTSVINFNFCSFELKVYDIANLLRRKMRKCNWDSKEAKVIIDSYASIEPVSMDEFIIMKIILQFPQKFWRVINKYYNSRRTWREKNYYSRIYEAIEEIDYHKRFLEEFDL